MNVPWGKTGTHPSLSHSSLQELTRCKPHFVEGEKGGPVAQSCQIAGSKMSWPALSEHCLQMWRIFSQLRQRSHIYHSTFSSHCTMQPHLGFTILKWDGRSRCVASTCRPMMPWVLVSMRRSIKPKYPPACLCTFCSMAGGSFP